MILTLLVAFCGTGAFAQKVSVGYIFEDYIFENYVGVKKLNEEFQKKQETFQTEFNKIALEYQDANVKYQESMKNIAVETSESLNTKLKKVQELRAAAETQQKESEKQLQDFMGTSIARVKEEIKAAAQTVSKQKGLQYVLSRNKADSPMSPYRVVLYTKDSAVPNISDDVLKILNSK